MGKEEGRWNMEFDIKFKIDRGEIKRYLRYKREKEIDPETAKEITECIEEMRQSLIPRIEFRKFQLKPIPTGFNLDHTRYSLEGRSITKHLLHANACYLLGATLGIEMDRILNRYKRFDLSKALICDACATTYIEEVCDQLTAHLQELSRPCTLTSRFSPGYGDFTLAYQPIILTLLDAPRKIGLTTNSEYILLPTKSVTAVIGVIENPNHLKETQNPKIYTRHPPKECESCRHVSSCYYLRRGQRCEYTRKTPKSA